MGRILPEYLSKWTTAKVRAGKNCNIHLVTMQILISLSTFFVFQFIYIMYYVQ